MSILLQVVAEAYNNAINNGYDLSKMSAEDIADDMIALDADLEREDVRSVVKCIKELRGYWIGVVFR